MTDAAQCAWVDRFITRLSRLQLDISRDMLVDMALLRWSVLSDAAPEAAAEAEYGQWPTSRRGHGEPTHRHQCGQ
jgi:hypothetical protein